MARAQSAFLCHSVLFTEVGTFSALGIGLTWFQVPSLPNVISFTAVAVVKWDEDECGQEHACVFRVSVDDETIARTTLTAPAPPWRPHAGSGTDFAQGLAFDVRRPGNYTVSVVVDGLELERLPFEISSQLPAF